MPRAASRLWAWRELIGMLVARTLKIRYKNSALGFFWTLLGPIFMILIYALFLGIMRFDINLPLLVSGILVWQFLSMCAGDALNTINGNANLVKKTAFPRYLLVLSMVLANAVNALLSLLVLGGYLIAAGTTWGHPLWLPLAFSTQFVLCLGLAYLIACANVFFRDTEHILGMALMAWFFLTPIIYPARMITDHFADRPLLQAAYFLNPMAGIVSAYRRFFLSETDVPILFLLVSLAVAWALLGVGWTAFRAVEPRFAEEL